MFSDETKFQPLAARLRPQSITEFVGQTHLLAPGKPLYEAIVHGKLHSLILWGPPGTGKTTLARLMAQSTAAHFCSLSAVMSGVKDIRAAVDAAKILRQEKNQRTILFVDEVHRFNKSQQDAFLPFIEDGTIIFVGATTENPSFELNSALLSRARVYVLKALTSDDIRLIIDQALAHEPITMSEKLRNELADFAQGDARSVLNFLEVMMELALTREGAAQIDEVIVKEVLTDKHSRFDKYGEQFYDLISALHKSVRGSAPDAALYWFARMLQGGCDPLYIARRVVRMANEDIGNADPRGLELALNAWEVQERLGSPEGELAIAQAIVYLACAAKSNAVYTAFNAAMEDAKQFSALEVPLHLRNAPTKLMRELNYGKAYRYAHDEPQAYAAGEQYFPEKLMGKVYYQPTQRGLEIKIAEKLAFLKALDKKSLDKSEE